MKCLQREGENMHIYSFDEFEKKQREYIKKNMYRPVMTEQYLPKNNVIKNYIYYEEPFKLF